MPQGVHERRVAANGISIRLLESGPAEATEAFLFLHDVTGSARRHWARELTDFGNGGYRSLAPDLRGHSGTTNDRIGLDQALMAEDAAALLRAIDLDRAHVVGYGTGGVIGIYLTLAHPEQVASLVTIGTPMAVDDHVRTWAEALLPERIQHDDPSRARLLAVLHAPEQVADAWDAGVAREPDYWRRLCHEAYDTSVVQPDWDDADLAAVKCPMLVGRGELDERVVQAQIDRIVGAAPAARAFVAPGARRSMPDAEHERAQLDALLVDWFSDPPRG